VSRTYYADCPNGCGGEVPVEIEYHVDSECGDSMDIWIDDEANATSHDEGCLPLTDEQRAQVEHKAWEVASDPGWWYDYYDD
jgi:hypothetical protein